MWGRPGRVLGACARQLDSQLAQLAGELRWEEPNQRKSGRLSLPLEQPFLALTIPASYWFTCPPMVKSGADVDITALTPVLPPRHRDRDASDRRDQRTDRPVPGARRRRPTFACVAEPGLPSPPRLRPNN